MSADPLTNPVFQMFECQNPDCCLRIPSNLSTEVVETCPFCKHLMIPVGDVFQNAVPQSTVAAADLLQIHILLDNLRSVFNVGSIFRTANGAAAGHIYCCGTTPTPDHPKFIKSGLRADDTVTWTYHRNAIHCVKNALEDGYQVVSLEISSNSDSIFGFTQHGSVGDKVLIVVGNEVSGIDPGILDLSDSRIHIPMLGNKTSLNVAIAAAIAIYTYRFNLISNQEL